MGDKERQLLDVVEIHAAASLEVRPVNHALENPGFQEYRIAKLVHEAVLVVNVIAVDDMAIEVNLQRTLVRVRIDRRHLVRAEQVLDGARAEEFVVQPDDADIGRVAWLAREGLVFLESVDVIFEQRVGERRYPLRIGVTQEIKVFGIVEKLAIHLPGFPGQAQVFHAVDAARFAPSVQVIAQFHYARIDVAFALLTMQQVSLDYSAQCCVVDQAVVFAAGLDQRLDVGRVDRIRIEKALVHGEACVIRIAIHRDESAVKRVVFLDFILVADAGMVQVEAMRDFVSGIEAVAGLGGSAGDIVEVRSYMTGFLLRLQSAGILYAGSRTAEKIIRRIIDQAVVPGIAQLWIGADPGSIRAEGQVGVDIECPVR